MSLKEDYITKVAEEPDMVKTIVMGQYFKYIENSPWFSLNGTPGEVRMLDDHLVYAVRDIEVFDTPRYDLCRSEKRDSRRVIRWQKVGTHQVG